MTEWNLRPSAMFADRADAARRLAARLHHVRGRRPLVLAIPRGAVVMGRILADQLAGDLDVALVRKLRAPGQPELAIGAVSETGRVYLADHLVRLPLSRTYVEREVGDQLAALRERSRAYRAVRPRVDPAGRTVILLDDGIATGSTMVAALRALRPERPRRLIVAAAVAPPDTVAKLRRDADEVVCLAMPAWLSAVGEFFRDFSEVTDGEVMAILRDAARAPETLATGAPGEHRAS